MRRSRFSTLAGGPLWGGRVRVFQLKGLTQKGWREPETLVLKLSGEDGTTGVGRNTHVLGVFHNVVSFRTDLGSWVSDPTVTNDSLSPTGRP